MKITSVWRVAVGDGSLETLKEMVAQVEFEPALELFFSYKPVTFLRMPIKDPEKRKAYHRDYMKNRWYPENKADHIPRVRKNKSERAAWLLDIRKGLSCEKCGESHVACLDFHHKDPSMKEFSVGRSTASGISKERILQEIQKCSVLCSNCHRKLHYDLRSGL